MAKSKKSKDEVEMAAVDTAAEGVLDMADAADTLQAADDVAAAGKMAQAAGVSDLTAAMDAEVVNAALSTIHTAVSKQVDVLRRIPEKMDPALYLLPLYLLQL